MTKQDIHIRITIEDVSMPVSLTFIKNNTRMIGNVTGIHVTALPVYHINFLLGNYKNLVFTIDDDLFLELLFLRIRGETIKFSSSQKKQDNLKEKKLLQDIEHLEITNTKNLQLLSDKKTELEDIRNVRLQGQIVRSRMKWLVEGEKPSSYFCNLENKNFLEKTIKKLKTQDGKILNDQKEILAYIKIYYENLFANKDSFLEDVNLAELLEKANIRTASDHELGNLITTPELGQVLKAMKHNKIPGMDGITTKFLIFFWAKLKYFVTNAINCCFLKGKLTTTLR